MTTIQGESYLKKKLFPVIENMDTEADTTKDIQSQANPLPYAKVSSENRQHAVDALESCKKKCKDITQVEACNLGCQIKYEANSDSTETITDAKYLGNPYDRWKKSYSIVVDKNSDIKISDKYKKWAPYHTYGNIWNGWKRVYYYYWTYYWGYRCYWSRWWWWWYRRCYWYPKWYRRRTYYWSPNWRWGITKRGTRITVPEVREKCYWKELHKYPKENTGRFDDIIEAKSCDDIITSNNIPDTDPDYYRDYSIHNMVDACNYGMNNYERKNCKVDSVDKETITCNETKSYGSIDFDTQNYQNELAKTRALTETPTETFTNNKKKEGFTNACKTKCSDVKTPGDIASMNSNSECYKCEVKYNPYIRYSAPREKLIREARYKANEQTQLNPKLYELREQQEGQKSKLDKKKEQQSTLANRNRNLFNDLKNMPPSKKRNATINAYLEDMKTKNPSKNIEYGIWIGLLAAAGISTAVLLKD